MKFIKSRKFMTTLFTVTFIILTQLLDVQIDETAYWSIVGVAITYIVGESHIDATKAKQPEATIVVEEKE